MNKKIHLDEDIPILFKNNLIKNSRHYNPSKFVLTSYYELDMTFKPNELEPSFTDILIIAQVEGGYGCCCCYGEIGNLNYLEAYIGKDIRTFNVINRNVQIALLDAGFSVIAPPPSFIVKLTGNSNEKAKGRASIVVYEVLKCMKNNSRPKVALVGAVANIITELINTGCEVLVTDLDSSVIGKSLGGVTIGDGHKKTLEYVSKSDIVIVTGSTFSSGTTMSIINTAINNDSKIIFYSQTGSNFAGELMQLGVDVVVSEKFPFYMIPGDSTIYIYRKEY
jgi:hypothetical protein